MINMKLIQSLALLFSISLFTGHPDGGNTNAGPVGVHFKIDGKQYDIPVVMGIYDKSKAMFVVYNAGLSGFPQTTIILSIGSNFTGGTGTFKSDANEKGFVFGFTLGNMKDMIGYAGGKDDPSNAFTVASTPISITVTAFSGSGTVSMAGNVTTQGTFSGKVYDFKNKKTVSLTDGTFNVHP